MSACQAEGRGSESRHALQGAIHCRGNNAPVSTGNKKKITVRLKASYPMAGGKHVTGTMLDLKEVRILHFHTLSG